MRLDEMIQEGIKNGIQIHAASESSTLAVGEEKQILEALENRPMLRIYVNLAVRREARRNGVRLKGIDWEGFRDFFVAIAPIIIEIIKMFM